MDFWQIVIVFPTLSLCLLAGSCCMPAKIGLPPLTDDIAADFRLISGVTLLKSTVPNDCAAEVLATLYTFLGRPATPDEARRDFTKDFQGRTPSIELVLAAKKRGFKPVLEKGTPELLKAKIDSGQPAIIMLELNTLAAEVNLALTSGDTFHFFIVTGYSASRECVVVQWYDGRRLIKTDLLLRAWQKAGFFLLTLSPPENG